MNKLDWQLNIPLDAILFDCDGTLSAIEGIDVLATLAGAEIAQAVQVLTAEAMGKSGMTPELYEKRLELVCPTKAQITTLGENYFTHRTADSSAVIRLLQQLGKTIYILSAGLYPAVLDFAKRLHIPPQNIFAVNIQFDENGRYRDFDRASPLIHNQGKRLIVEQIIGHHQRVLYMGDGLNDLAVYDLVTRFVGYGGAYYRQNIADQCEFYIRASSLTPLLPLALTLNEYQKLAPDDKKLYEMGMRFLER